MMKNIVVILSIVVTIIGCSKEYTFSSKDNTDINDTVFYVLSGKPKKSYCLFPKSTIKFFSYNKCIWDDGDTGNFKIINQPGLYNVRYTYPVYPVTIDTIVCKNCPYDLSIAKVFTPNSDAYNDYFRIEGNGIINFDMKIFDSYGVTVFETHSISDFWRGKDKKGNKLSSGVYYYIIHCKFLDNSVKLYKGDIRLNQDIK
jgi:gliding motility-associated-like protein